MSSKTQPESTTRPANVTIPELEQSKTAVLNTLASRHYWRSYEYAIGRFIDLTPPLHSEKSPPWFVPPGHHATFWFGM